MRHLVIGQRQKAPNFLVTRLSDYHWSAFGNTRVVHLPKRNETNLITESDQSRTNHQLLQLCTARTAWSDSDQAVRPVHSCKSWFPTMFMLICFLAVHAHVINDRSVKLAMGSTIDIQLCIGRHSLRISSYEIDIQLCIQLIIRGIKEYRAVRSTFSSAFKIKHTLNIELWVRHSALHSKTYTLNIEL